jgi:hypothetical protein
VEASHLLLERRASLLELQGALLGGDALEAPVREELLPARRPRGALLLALRVQVACVLPRRNQRRRRRGLDLVLVQVTLIMEFAQGARSRGVRPRPLGDELLDVALLLVDGGAERDGLLLVGLVSSQHSRRGEGGGRGVVHVVVGRRRALALVARSREQRRQQRLHLVAQVGERELLRVGRVESGRARPSAAVGCAAAKVELERELVPREEQMPLRLLARNAPELAVLVLAPLVDAHSQRDVEASRMRVPRLARDELIELLARHGVAGDPLAEGKRREDGVDVAPRARRELLGTRLTIDDEPVDEDGERLAHVHRRDGRGTAVDDASAQLDSRGGAEQKRQKLGAARRGRFI